MEEAESRKEPIALFMAFGTKGDVYPLAVISLSHSKVSVLESILKALSFFCFVLFCLQAIAAALARDQPNYSVFLITHLAHEVEFLSFLS